MLKDGKAFSAEIIKRLTTNNRVLIENMLFKLSLNTGSS